MFFQGISSYLCPTKVYMGVNAHTRIEEILKKNQAKSCLLLCDPALVESAIAARIKEVLTANGMAFAVFSDVEPDPSAATVEKALAVCRQQQAELVIALGGGSAMDVGKAVGIVATNGGRIHDYEGIERFSTPKLPMIAIPTTAGTGSEVSGSCVITDTERGLKMSVRHAALNPAEHAILDPLAVSTLPAPVAAHSGLDAFVHALESYISRNANPITDAINIEAIAMISGSIRQFYADRGNTEAALDMLCGSCLAGMTFGQTGLGNVHCLARFIGARYHLSHGLSNALCLPIAERFNVFARPEKFARVASAMGKDVRGLHTLEAARLALDAIRELCADLDIPQRLRDVGVREDELEELAELAANAGYNKWNPRQTSRADFLAMLRAAY